MHNGNGHGNGKRWLLIGLLILGGFWLVNDSYRDGYTDALVQTGQVENVRYYRGGPHFPWGLLILGGVGYIAWRKGAFDRFGGPGGPFGGAGHGGRGVQYYRDYGQQQSPGQGFGPAFRGPRAFFDEWHRQSHQAAQAHHQAPAAPPAPPAQTDNGPPRTTTSYAPPPPPPAPDYWTAMARATGGAETGGAASATSAPAGPAVANGDGRPDGFPQGASGPAPERW